MACVQRTSLVPEPPPFEPRGNYCSCRSLANGTPVMVTGYLKGVIVGRRFGASVGSSAFFEILVRHEHEGILFDRFHDMRRLTHLHDLLPF